MSVETALWMMGFMYPVFLAELLTAEGMLVSASKRRPYFWVFLISSLVLLVAVVFAVCCIMTLCNGNAIAGAVGYFVVFLFTLVILRVCFEVPFKVLLFFGTGAYAFQNLCYRTASILELTGVVGAIGGRIGYGWADLAVHVGVFLVAAVIFWFSFVRKVRKQGMEHLYSWNVLLLSLVTLIITIGFCSVTNSYGWMSPQLSLVNYCFAIVGNIFILWIQSGMLERVALKSDIETVRNLWQQDKRQYEIAKETIDLINIKCHDMKHKIRALNAESGLSTEEAAEVEKCISIYDARVSTGCEPIDVLLTEKSLICNRNDIVLSCVNSSAMPRASASAAWWTASRSAISATTTSTPCSAISSPTPSKRCAASRTRTAAASTSPCATAAGSWSSTAPITTREVSVSKTGCPRRTSSISQTTGSA